MTANDRLEALVHRMHTNIKALSELCGYDRPQAFYDIQKGKTKNISPAMCEKIMNVFPNLNRVWLLTGEGSMFAEEPKAAEEDAQQPATVPLLHLSALAGPLQAYYEEGEDITRCERIVSMHPDAELAIQINGDSMEPTFSNGSLAFIKRINEQAFIPWGYPLVLDTSNGIYLKIVLPDNDDPQYILAESTNPKYPAMRIPKSEVSAMFRVLYVAKSFLTM